MEYSTTEQRVLAIKPHCKHGNSDAETVRKLCGILEWNGVDNESIVRRFIKKIWKIKSMSWWKHWHCSICRTIESPKKSVRNACLKITINTTVEAIDLFRKDAIRWKSFGKTKCGWTIVVASGVAWNKQRERSLKYKLIYMFLTVNLKSVVFTWYFYL